jgi:hypothetical protein
VERPRVRLRRVQGVGDGLRGRRRAAESGETRGDPSSRRNVPHELDVRELHRDGLLDECTVGGERLRQWHAHVIVPAARGELDADALRAEHVRQRAQGLQREAQTVRDRPAPRIRARVRGRVEELVHEVPAGAVQLDAVEASLLRVLGTAAELWTVVSEVKGAQPAWPTSAMMVRGSSTMVGWT